MNRRPVHCPRGPTLASLWLGWAALVLMSGLALAQDGAALYGQWCVGCHGADAKGIPGAFPPLAGNPRVQDETYVVGVIQQGKNGPLEVAGQTYNGVMPALAQIPQAEAQAIATYLKGLGSPATSAPAATPAPAPAPAAAATPAMVEQGRALYTGATPLANGGAPCLACHNAGKTGALGGGSLGLDLTTVHTRLGQAGLQGVLTTVAFPVMRQSFQGHPLTPQEIEALTAFLASIAQETPTPAATRTTQLLLAGLVGMAVLFGVMGALWRNRRIGVAERIRTTHRRKA